MTHDKVSFWEFSAIVWSWTGRWPLVLGSHTELSVSLNGVILVTIVMQDRYQPNYQVIIVSADGSE